MQIIGACLAFGTIGGVGFEEFVRRFFTVKEAAKFVVRRIGIIGAISCVGGVIWEYL